jgi:chemotaxis methyl-accepting protein methylase
MAEKMQLHLKLDVTEEQRQRIERLAQRHGFDTVDEYVRVLIEQDADEQGEEALFDAYTKEELLRDFRQAWQDAMTGNVLPLSALDELDDE